MSETTIDLATWSVHQGGYNRRRVLENAGSTTPERGAAINDTITALGSKSLALIDAYGWEFPNNPVAEHIRSQYLHTYFAPLNDARIQKVYGEGAGNVYATMNRLELARPLDMHDRAGIVAIEDVGGKTILTASYYGADIAPQNPDLSRQQITAALHDIEQYTGDVDFMLLTGDYNSLPPETAEMPLRSKRDDLIVRTAGKISMLLPAERMFDSQSNIIKTLGYYGLFARNINRRNVITELQQRGWQTANQAHIPTASAPLHIGLPVDHTFYKSNETPPVDVSYEVIPVGGASDHPISRVRIVL